MTTLFETERKAKENYYDYYYDESRPKKPLNPFRGVF